MTVLTKPVRRELPGTFDRRSWVVSLHPWGLEFRAKRTKKTYPVLWAQVWNRAMALAADNAKREREERRKLRKKGLTA